MRGELAKKIANGGNSSRVISINQEQTGNTANGKGFLGLWDIEMPTKNY